MKMAKIGLPKGSGNCQKSVKSQGIFKVILSGNPGVRVGGLVDEMILIPFIVAF